MSYTTLNHALGKLVNLVPMGVSLGYGQVLRMVQDGMFISVTRFNDGSYEAAISYKSKCDNYVEYRPLV